MTPLIPSQLRPDVEDRFETVYRTHVRDVYAFSLGMLGHADDAEDVTQTTFLNAYRALRKGEDVRNLRAWLLAIAHNVCRQRFRTAARRPREVELDPEAAEAFVDEDAPSAAEIRQAMRELSFNQRTVLVLREIEGLSYEEIAQAMGISLSAVETLLFRARRALREQLEAAENDLGCHAVERLISLQLNGKLSRQDKGLLRAHLRTCAECARFARSQRARKRVMASLVAVPLPSSLSGAFGGGLAGGGGGVVASKAAALAVSAALVGTGALVETGVVDPGRKAPRVEAAGARAGPVAPPEWSPAASVRRILAAPETVEGASATKAPPASTQGKARPRKAGPVKARPATAAAGTKQESASENGSEPVQPTPSGVTSDAPSATAAAPVLPPPPLAVPDAAGPAEGKIPPPPASLPVAPPSLPPVTVPDVTGSLP
jgi:RNA polymerase sigma factor (sigma-70 family)